MNYWLGIIGALVLADGLASIWQYTKPDMNHNQTWLRDHSFRIFRCFLGIAVIWIGATQI